SGRPLKPISYHSTVASAQIKTCVLMAGLAVDGTTTFVEPAQSRNHTELMLPQFGVDVVDQPAGAGRQVRIEGGQELTPVDYRVPGGRPSVAFFVAAATLCPESSIVIRGVGLNPTRAGFLEVLDRLGARITRTGVGSSGGELVGDISVASSELSATE